MSRPKFEYNLTIFMVLQVCFIICVQDTATAQSTNTVCETEVCKSIASDILQKMNKTVDPCTNFYDYVCGNFTENAEIAIGRGANHLFWRVRDSIRENLRDDIENIASTDLEAFQQLRVFYNTCLDETKVEANSNNELLEILKDLGSWPVLVGDSFDESKFDWKNVISKISKLGYTANYLFSFNIYSNLKNAAKNLINIDVASFEVPYLSQGLDNEIVKSFFNFMVDVAEILGANRTKANDELLEVFNFETELLQIYDTDSGLDDEGKYNLMNISELQTTYPFISWLNYMNDVLSPIVLTEAEVVAVNVPTYLTNLSSLLDSTPKRVLSNYLLWRVVFETSDELNQKVRDAKLKYTANIDGNRNRTLRWQTCTDSVMDNLYLSTSSLYARRNFNKSSIKDDFSDMLERVRQSYKTTLLQSDWMDNSTRNTAVNKLDEMVALIAHPDEILEDKKIEDYYKNLTLIPESYLRTVLSCKRYQTVKVLETYRDTVDRLNWTDTISASFAVNAYYTPSSNAIRFLAGMMRSEFYNLGFPRYVNYGALGFFVGHEMGHAFDTNGKNFDAIGNFANWWTTSTATKFTEKADCFIGQYSNYTVPQVNLTISGSLTQAENIADNGGIKQVYNAYDLYEKENGVEQLLPGFESFTTKQLFWISNANMWCAKYRDEWMRDAVLTDDHTPNPYRLIGMVSNNLNFSSDFSCASGSPMNPVSKCSLW